MIFASHVCATYRNLPFLLIEPTDGDADICFGPHVGKFVLTANRLEFNVVELLFQNPVIQTESGNNAIQLCEPIAIEKDKH